MVQKKQDFLHFFISSFNHCFFLSLLILSIGSRQFAKIGVLYHHLPLVNAFLSLLLTIFLYALFRKKRYFKMYSKRYIKYLMVVSLITGALSFYMATYYVSTYLIAIVITSLTIKNIKIFSTKMAHLLDINVVASKKDLAEFFDFFINLILTFTVINFAFYTGNQGYHIASPFNFDSDFSAIVDSLYFTVITMTSVGFGDITPQTEVAKILVAFQGLISYLMFGLMIGIVSRGVDFKKK